MKTYLISGPQGTGKTTLVNLIDPDSKIENFNILGTYSKKQLLDILRNGCSSLLIIDEVYENKRIIDKITEAYKDEDLNIIFISNSNIIEFEKFKFDLTFNIR